MCDAIYTVLINIWFHNIYINLCLYNIKEILSKLRKMVIYEMNNSILFLSQAEQKFVYYIHHLFLLIQIKCNGQIS